MSVQPPCILAAIALNVAIAERTLVRDLGLELAPGEFLAVLGCNGSGKTLMLHTLAGLRPASGGTVMLDGRPLHELSRRTLALRVGLLAQDREEGLTTSVHEAVLIGRHPHLRALQWESATDYELASQCLARVDLAELAPRSLETLSGGEQRRAAIAALLAQDPQIFLLDEPTNHLDPQHQLAVLRLFHELTRTGRSVIATLHDATLAARFADRVLLLFGDGRWRCGPAEQVLSAAALAELYHTPMLEVAADRRRVFVSA